MAQSIFVVTIHWQVSTVNPPLVDAALSEMGDWIRFNAETWLLYTGQPPTEIRDLVIKHLTSSDHVLVLPISLTEPADGWAQPWVWTWLRDRAMSAQASRYAALPPPSS